MREALQARGYDLTEDGEIVGTGPAAPADPVVDDDDDLASLIYSDPKAATAKIQQQTAESVMKQLQQPLGGVMSAVETVARAQYARDIPDWTEIGDLVEAECRTRGLTPLKAQQTGNFDLICNAARWQVAQNKGGQPAPAPPAPTTDAQETVRQLLATLAASAGGGSGEAPVNLLGPSPDDKAKMEKIGMSTEEFEQFGDKARVDIFGEKQKGGKK